MEAGITRLTAGQQMERGPEMSLTQDPEKVREYGTLEMLVSGIKQESSVASWIDEQNYKSDAESVDGYDPMPLVPDDLVPYLSEFRNVTSPEQFDLRVNQLRAESNRREMLSHGGGAAFWGQTIGFLSSPEMWPLLVWSPIGAVGGITKTATQLGGALIAEATVHEGLMHSTQSQRTLYESLGNVGVAGILGVTLGTGIGLMGARGAIRFADDVGKNLDETVNNQGFYRDPEIKGDAGAAKSGYGLDEAQVNNPWIKSRWLAIGRPIWSARSPEALGAFNRYWGHDRQTVANLKGIAKETALSRRVDRESAQFHVQANVALQEGYIKYIGYKGSYPGLQKLKPSNRGQYRKFNNEVRYAMSHGDESTNPAVKTTAQKIRADVYDPLEAMAKKAGLMDEGQDVVKWARSYQNRRYNRAAIRKNPTLFRQALREGFIEQRARDAAVKAGEEPSQWTRFVEREQEVLSELETQVDDTYTKIMNGDFGNDAFMHRSVTGSAFQERKIPISDTKLLDNEWLETDMIDQVTGYVNHTLRPARMIDEAGDTEMTGVLENIKREYNNMVREAPKAEQASLEVEREIVLDSMRIIRNRYYGRPATMQSDSGSEIIRNLGKAARNLNVTLMMGMVTATSFADIARVNIATIFAPELGKLGPNFIDALRTARISKSAYKKWGVAHETATMLRTSRLMDNTGHMESSSIMVRTTEKMAQGLMKATFLGQWTDQMKIMSAAYTQNDMIQKMANWSRLSTKNKAVMAERGVDEQFATDVMQEFRKHGQYHGKATDLNIDAWENQATAERMKDIIFRQSERALVTPGVSDLPAKADTELGKLLLQFKSFSLSAHNQLTLPLMERLRAGDPKAVQLMSQMVALGMVTHVLRMGAQGRLDEFDDYTPADWALNSVDYSGALPLILMGFNGVDLMSGNQLTDLMGAMPSARYSDRAVGSALGPTFGTASGLIRASASLADGVDERDARTLRRLIPFNNLAWTHYAVTQTERAISEGLGLEKKRRGRSKKESSF